MVIMKVRKESGDVGQKAKGLNLSDAIKMAIEKPEFGQELLSDPEKFSATFNLNSDHIKLLKTITPDELKKMPAIKNPSDFAAGVQVTEEFLRAHAKDIFGKDFAVKKVYS